ncbi:hypothetical protein AX777_05855 [Sphingobium yanoikuyae]|uniref:Uncharacterized protein n=1 Tax=Sphingobium yanoikuyae TaxID=13690 RepID=A0A177JQV1_SPHYA|nr:hypothetical protein [Sphingobium yanoikuyae]OAH42761.1 hypothetical protein AX777_05855 [Sphingobium yanoikuyae]
MADIKDIEVRYIPALSDDAIVYVDKIGIIDKATGEPVEFTAAEAVLSISENERSKLLLSLDNGLVWNDVEKTISVVIRNHQMRFVRADTQLEYALSVRWTDSQLAKTLREGTVTAVRVA